MFKIIGTYQGRSEVIDEADDEKTAKYLVGEYRMAFGATWLVTYVEDRG